VREWKSDIPPADQPTDHCAGTFFYPTKLPAMGDDCLSF
jgi:hypothetical protein